MQASLHVIFKFGPPTAPSATAYSTCLSLLWSTPIFYRVPSRLAIGLNNPLL